jgi:hypothetical protein
VVPEAELVSTEHGLVPKGQGWFVLNARETQWWARNGRGFLCEFEGAVDEAAQPHDCGVERETTDAGEAYAASPMADWSATTRAGYPNSSQRTTRRPASVRWSPNRYVPERRRRRHVAVPV